MCFCKIMNLNPQAQKIYDILQDRCWHCPIEWGYADGHAKRITDINEYLKPLGLEVKSEWCDCGRHTARIKKRKIGEKLPYLTEGARIFMERNKTDWKPVKQEQLTLI